MHGTGDSAMASLERSKVKRSICINANTTRRKFRQARTQPIPHRCWMDRQPKRAQILYILQRQEGLVAIIRDGLWPRHVFCAFIQFCGFTHYSMEQDFGYRVELLFKPLGFQRYSMSASVLASRLLTPPTPAATSVGLRHNVHS